MFLRSKSRLLFVFLLAVANAAVLAEEVLMEEVVVEGAFDATLELRQDRAVDELTKRLQLRAEMTRALELEKANESMTTKLFNLTSYIPFPLQASENRVDTFFQQNYMRADLNPRRDDPLGLGK
jgi:hypothetical protein